VVRSWFDFENTVPRNARRSGVYGVLGVVRFLHKTDEKPVRTAFGFIAAQPGKKSYPRCVEVSGIKQKSTAEEVLFL